MKHLAIVALGLFLTSALFSQTPYLPMVVEGATWVQRTTDDQFGVPQQFAVRIMEDTVIENMTYRKLYSIPLDVLDNTVADLSQKFLHGFLREDTIQKQVFFRSAALLSAICNEAIGDEVLLYEFSVGQGDTTHICMTNHASRPDTVVRSFYVDHVLDIPVFGLDSILTVQLLDSAFLSTFEMYFEAVGNVFGPIGQRSHPGYNFGFVDRGLVKYCRHDSLCSIQIITSLEKPIRSSKLLEVHPNVVTRGQVIPLMQELERLTLIAASGKMVSALLRERTFSVPQACTPGLYYLKGVDRFGNTYNQKIIIY